ncbi:cupin domain-containing protein [Desulfotomaculum copahuensis]|uniref:Cupin n=1 Tax=Desulfotomaculum copahuensis TaxID=1838280 RepID=A0A1B7LFY2_9FIRM|nr:cupin domain-containing protein [Desulfotomaculum copahuensis]OAT83628.1 cupin [Desulfotomaculum copahuensis]
MDIIKVADLPVMQTGWGIKGKQVVDLPDIGIINLILEPGEKVPSHKTPVDVLFQVIEGKGTVIIGEDNQIAEAGDIIISPAQVPHSLVADQNSRFSFYVIKVPNTMKSAVKENK